MNEEFNPMNPTGPVGPSVPNPATPGPIYDESSGSGNIFKIIIGVLGFVLLILLILVVVYVMKANRTTAYINQKVEEGKATREREVKDACELEKKDIRENPWVSVTSREELGAFKFIVPRSWAQYEHFDINANEPLNLYFNPEMVRYDSAERIKTDHAALEVTVSKKLYAKEVDELKIKIKKTLDPKTEDSINISNFTGTKFTYKDKDLGRNVGVIILPYRDRALFIKTDDYDKWGAEYYKKFFESFALTQ